MWQLGEWVLQFTGDADAINEDESLKKNRYWIKGAVAEGINSSCNSLFFCSKNHK
jgi:hypothetical protein